MYTLEWFWGKFSFSLAFIIAIILVCYHLPKKRYFILKFIVIFSLWIGSLYLFEIINFPFYVSYVIQYVLALIMIMLIYKSDFWTAVFCSTVGYCLQHISERTYEIIKIFCGPFLLWQWILFLSSLTIVFYFLFFILFIRKQNYENIYSLVDHKNQLVISTIVLFTAIYLNAEICFLTIASENKETIKLYAFTFSILFCFVIIILEYTLLGEKKQAYERDQIKAILDAKREKYESEKQTMDLLRIKYHDIKHILKSFDNNIDATVIKEIKSSLTLYESIIKTGNEAIDTIVTKK